MISWLMQYCAICGGSRVSGWRGIYSMAMTLRLSIPRSSTIFTAARR